MRRSPNEFARIDALPRLGQRFHLIVDGKTAKEIATDLLIGPKTVEKHRAELMHRFKVGNTASLVAHAIRFRLAL